MKIEINNRRLKELIFSKNIDIRQIADESKISSRQIYRIINGEQGKVFERTAFSLANALHCNLNDLTFKIKQ